jgi:hypothetical protein
MTELMDQPNYWRGVKGRGFPLMDDTCIALRRAFNAPNGFVVALLRELMSQNVLSDFRSWSTESTQLRHMGCTENQLAVQYIDTEHCAYFSQSVIWVLRATLSTQNIFHWSQTLKQRHTMKVSGPAEKSKIVTEYITASLTTEDVLFCVW